MKDNNRTTAAGLFVALIKERGFIRDRETGHYVKRMDNGDTHSLIIDYVPTKAALLVVNAGSGGVGELGESACSVHYDEQPLPTKTLEYLARQQRKPQRRQATPYRGKRQPQGKQPAWKADLKDAQVTAELRALLGE